jgi:hypothetical protein
MPVDIVDLGELEDWTLEEYVARLKAHWHYSGDENETEAAEALERFVHVGLTGRAPGGKTTRISLTDAYVTPEQASRFTIRRDYDSLIGWSTDLPLQCPVDIYLIPRFRDTLKKDIHIQYPMRGMSNGSEMVSGRIFLLCQLRMIVNDYPPRRPNWCPSTRLAILAS